MKNVPKERRNVVRIDRISQVLTGLMACGALAFVSPLAAASNTVPSYASGSGETIHGTIASLSGKYSLSLSDDRGFTDSVTMHDGTVITPTGLSLEVGQDVTIIGHTDGKTFDADEIDTDGAEAYDSAPSTSYYEGPYDAGAYPPYVVSLGGGGYYYGSNFGGYGGGFGGYGGAGGYGGYGGYYYSNPGYSTSQGSVTTKSPSTNVPVSSGGSHPAPIPHPPIGRPPASPRFSSGFSGASHSSASSTSSHSRR